MHAVAWLLVVAASFWETKAPSEWTKAELIEIRRDSPWARPATPAGPIGGPGIATYLATAGPMRAMEAELARRAQIKPEENPLADYYEFLAQNEGKVIVLAVYFPDWMQLADGKEVRRMTEQCVMRAGRKKYQMTGHFPPLAADPYLRLVFPRRIGANDKSVSFDLYLPGVIGSFREVEYGVKELMLKGKLEL